MTPLVEGQSSGEITHNESLNELDAAVLLTIKDRDLTAPPGGESDGDRYLVGASATAAWSGHDGEIAAYYSGWIFFTVLEGWRMWVDDENKLLIYNGSAWVEVSVKDTNDSSRMSVEATITASTTQSQGQQPLTKEINEVSVCANANDVVTLPSAVAGLLCIIANNGAQTLQIYPASGDNIQGTGVDTSVTLAAGARVEYYAYDATNWM
jgi:hypothetical protein